MTVGAPGHGRDPQLNADELLERIANSATRRSVVIGAAESLTGGKIGTALASVPQSSDWFGGSVVVYRDDSKRSALGVTAEEVVSAQCAEQMAAGVLELFGCEVAVSTTGVGGPRTQEDKEPGTVYIGVAVEDEISSFSYDFEGEPDDVLEQTVLHALHHLLDQLDDA